MNKKVLMVATTAAMIEQFNKNNIKILNDLDYSVDVAGNWEEGNPISDERLEAFKKWITDRSGNYYHIPATRKPSDLKNNIKSINIIVDLIEKNKYEFIHCHTPIGSVIARIAAHKTHTKVIYTAHGFHFYKGAPLKNWLIYYPVEKFLSRWTDCLVTINKEDYNRARNKFYAKRVEYIPGVGVDTQKFYRESINGAMTEGDHSNQVVTRQRVRKELGISFDRTVILSVGELNKNKNHEMIIRALSGRNDISYVIVGKGEREEYLNKLATRLNVNIQLMGFRSDVKDFYAMADLFAFPSFREGLSVSLMEAMASGLPVVCSNIRGNTDLIDENGGVLFEPNSVNSIKRAIEEILADSYREKMGKYNLNKIKNFDSSIVMEDMKRYYERL